MKNAILLHGSSGSPNSFWLPSISRYLKKSSFKVWVPQLPKPEAPNLKLQLPFVLKNGNYNNETIIISHSAACPLTLSILENIVLYLKEELSLSFKEISVLIKKDPSTVWTAYQRALKKVKLSKDVR